MLLPFFEIFLTIVSSQVILGKLLSFLTRTSIRMLLLSNFSEVWIDAGSYSSCRLSLINQSGFDTLHTEYQNSFSYLNIRFSRIEVNLEAFNRKP